MERAPHDHRAPRPPRLVRLLDAQFALHDALRTVERAAAPVAPPHGMRWIVTPREALEITPAGDDTMLRQVFARFVFWRLLLTHARPTPESLHECARRLRGLALYRYALAAHAAHRPLPLKAGTTARDVPAYALTAPEHLHALHTPHSTHTRAAGDDTNTPDTSPDLSPEASAELAPDAGGLATDELLLTMRWWDAFGDDAEMLASDLFDARTILSEEDYAAAGAGLRLRDLFGMLAGQGLSDLQIAGVLDSAWNGQAALWAGQQVYDGAGLGASFDMRDPWFFDYLRNQSGYLIKDIDTYTRRNIADDLWGLLGGPGGPGLSWEAIQRYLSDKYALNELDGLIGYSGNYRAFMIALTETARAEGFGTFVSLWQTGAQKKRWIVQAGACLRCLTNAEAGDIPLMDAFPTRVIAPPAHPICKCSVAASLPDTFNPDEWVSRNPQDLAPYLSNWSGALWPSADSVDLGEMADIDMTDLESAGRMQDAEVRRQRTRKARHARHAPHAAHLSAAQYQALGQAAVTLVTQAGERWAASAHVALPNSDDDLKRLLRRLRDRDELPDAREADEVYIHTVREGLRDLVTAERDTGGNGGAA